MKSLALAAAAVGTSGCGQRGATAGGEGAATPVRGERITFAAQADRGAELYAQHCAMCHGDDGRGTPQAPPLVGPGALPREPRPAQALRTEEFRTAADVFEFVSEHMPLDAPGSLGQEEYAAVLAFALQQNGVEPDEPLTEASARQIVLPEERPAARR